MSGGNEIQSFLRVRRKRLALALLIPVIAGGLALAASLHIKDRYEATIDLEILAPESDTPNAAVQASTRLSRLATSESVVEAAAEDADQPVAKVQRGVSTNQDGAKVAIRYNATLPPDVVEKIALADANASVAALFAPAIDEAERAVTEADRLDVSARETLSAFEVAHGLTADPDNYRAVLQPPEIVEYERMLAAVVRSGNGLDRTERDRDALVSRLNTTTAQVPSFADHAVRVSSTTLIARRVTTAVAAGLVLAIALLLLAEVLLPPRTEEPREVRPDDAVETLRRLTARVAAEDRETEAAAIGGSR